MQDQSLQLNEGIDHYREIDEQHHHPEHRDVLKNLIHFERKEKGRRANR